MGRLHARARFLRRHGVIAAAVPSLEAHAWLRAGSIAVTGGGESRAFHPVAWFATPTDVALPETGE